MTEKISKLSVLRAEAATASDVLRVQQDHVESLPRHRTGKRGAEVAQAYDKLTEMTDDLNALTDLITLEERRLCQA